MVCQEYNSLTEYLRQFNGTDPVGAAVCPYMNDAGAGMPVTVFALFTFGIVGLSLTARTRHPAPLVVAGILSASTVAAFIPGIAAKMLALVVLLTLTAAAFYLYQRASTSL